MQIMGIDIGGSGIKGAPVDLEQGDLAQARHRIATPQPSTPLAVAKIVAQIVDYFQYEGPIGCTFPAIVQHGVTLSAANVDDSWIGAHAEQLFTETVGQPVRVLNDADAAGIAEMAFGAGRGRQGVVMILTFGTGIGSAIFTEGVLLPNTEFGHVQIRGMDAEHRAAARIRDEEDLSWKEWAARANEFLQYLELLFSPDLFIIGGGVSKKFNKFSKHLKVKAEMVPAELGNNAGIVGAAMAAKALLHQADKD